MEQEVQQCFSLLKEQEKQFKIFQKEHLMYYDSILIKY